MTMDDQPGKAFCEPWQAQVFVFALKLSEAGHFTWTEWTEHFGAYLRASAAATGTADDKRPMPTVDSPEYYEVFLDALEALLAQRGLATMSDLAHLKTAWTEAYLRTPHGKPVKLENDHDDDHHDHAHSHH
jgi:nitrile hydratase accessory protein